jgi:hypothetical protein
MKCKAIVTETVTYHIEFEAPEDANDDLLDELAREEWGTNPDRDPDNYECDIEVDYPVSDEARSYGPRK